MFKIKENPIQQIEDKFDLMGTLLRHHHIKSNQALIVSLGMDESSKSYTFAMSFNEYNGYDPSEVTPTVFRMSFPIVKTDGFTIDNAIVARKVFFDYYHKDKDQIKKYLDVSWRKYHLKLDLDSDLSDDFKKHFTNEEIKKILEGSNSAS